MDAASDSLAAGAGAGVVCTSEAGADPMAISDAAAAVALASASAARNCAQGMQGGVAFLTREDVMLPCYSLTGCIKTKLQHETATIDNEILTQSCARSPGHQSKKQAQQTHNNNRDDTLVWT